MLVLRPTIFKFWINGKSGSGVQEKKFVSDTHELINKVSFYELLGVENQMGLAIKTNAAALKGPAASVAETSRLQVSTGNQAKSAIDYARVSAIDYDYTAQIQGAKMAFRNALEAQGVIGTSEGAHEFLEKVLLRARRVIIQSPATDNSANTPVKNEDDPALLVKEVLSSAKNQMSEQAPTAVNALANASQQSVLSLLQV